MSRGLLVRTIVVLLAVALAASGCVRRRGSTTGRVRVSARQERQLRQQASREIGCPGAGLVLTPLSDRVYQVHGCGQLRDYAVGVGRRRGWSPLQPVYVRAAAEMACPLQQLQIAAPTATIRSAAGCGRTARYDLVCGAVDCAWMMTAHGGAWAGEQQVTVAAAPTGGALPPGVVTGAEPSIAGPPIAGAGTGGAGTGGAGTGGAGTGGAGTGGAGTAAAPSPLDDIAIPEPPASGSAEALLRAALDARRDAIRRCAAPVLAGAGSIDVRASWSAEGAVTIALEPPLAGTAAEGCVRAELGAQQVPPGSSGEVVHPIL